MSNFNPSGGGLQYLGTRASSPPNTWVFNHAPTPYDTQGFSLGDFWLYLKNNTTNQLYALVDIRGDATAKRSLATWVLFSTSSSGAIISLTGNDSVVVFPDAAGNISILGTGPITVSGTANTETISIAVATTTTQGTVQLSTNASAIAGTDTSMAIVPSTLKAKLGTQTLNGIAYGNGTTNAILWTAEGATGTVLIGTSGAPAYSAHPVVTQVTINGMVSNPTDAATKAYVDSFVSGFSFQPSCRVATTANLTVTYANGAAGVGATLTNNGVQAALSIDGVALIVNDRVLVKNQTTQFQNGIYTVTDIGSGATNWVMTRATDYDQAPAEIKPGNIVPITTGTLNSNSLWVQTATVTTIGTDSIVFVAFGTNPVVPLPIAEGGTNSISFTETNGTVYFDGTQLKSIDPGTTGQFLLSNGAAMPPSFQTASPGGSGIFVTVYNTPGAFTWTADASTKIVEIFGWGGGGGGASGGGSFGSGGGGGGGCFYYRIPISFLNSPVSGVVGAGGGGGVAGNGSIGGPSSLGNFTTGGTPTRPSVALLPLSGGGTNGGNGGTGGFVMTMTNSLAFSLGPPNQMLTLNPGAQGGAINNSFGTMLPTGGAGGLGNAGGSVLNPHTSAVIIAGGTAGTAMSPNGGNGNQGFTLSDFMSGGTGGGSGFNGTTGTGGVGGFPGGGGGAGGSGGGNGGSGGDGLIIVFEYF